METNRVRKITTFRVEVVKRLRTFPIPSWDKDGTSQRVTHFEDLNPINTITHHFEDRTVILQLLLLPANKNFGKTTISHQRKHFISPQLIIASKSYRTFARLTAKVRTLTQMNRKKTKRQAL